MGTNKRRSWVADNINTGLSGLLWVVLVAVNTKQCIGIRNTTPVEHTSTENMDPTPLEEYVNDEDTDLQS